MSSSVIGQRLHPTVHVSYESLHSLPCITFFILFAFHFFLFSQRISFGDMVAIKFGTRCVFVGYRQASLSYRVRQLRAFTLVTQRTVEFSELPRIHLGVWSYCLYLYVG